VVQPFKVHVYLVTAEAVESPARLNPHLAYMSSQGDQILLKGFSTNWNMSVLRFHLAEKAPGPGGEVEFAKDADWLIATASRPKTPSVRAMDFTQADTRSRRGTYVAMRSMSRAIQICISIMRPIETGRPK